MVPAFSARGFIVGRAGPASRPPRGTVGVPLTTERLWGHSLVAAGGYVYLTFDLRLGRHREAGT